MTRTDRARRLLGMDVHHGARRLGGAVSDATGRTPAELGVLMALAVVAAGTIVAVRAIDVVHRLWTPSGGRA
jgi:hypothetical protein